MALSSARWRPLWTSRLLAAAIFAMLCSATGCAKSPPKPVDSEAWTIPTGPAQHHYQFSNRLVNSNDPYLLLHAHNPVDWYPWGSEAFAEARREHKPIFLSVGYSTCYWCHVAERTIYSNPDIAKLMNAWFISVKVDREERPDVDRVYMLATELMTHRGGWPNNVFLTPDLKPFFGGSYFSPQDFTRLLHSIHDAWSTHSDQITALADRVSVLMRSAQQQLGGARNAGSPRPSALMGRARTALLQSVDWKQGGFSDGSATKFPQPPALALLLADYRSDRNAGALRALQLTLDAMAYGGVFDQIGGGFHRYSTEPTWSIPHFEKMLSDNAQLLEVYAQAYQLTRDDFYRNVAADAAHYLTREMLSPEGGFYTAQDAQVNGVEGATYLWTRAQIIEALGSAAAGKFFAVYSLTPMPGAQAGSSSADAPGVLRIGLPISRALRESASPSVEGMLAALAPAREKLLTVRKGREQPARDEKIVVGQNGLAIQAFAEAGGILGDQAYVEVARRAADFVWKAAYDGKSGDLRHEIFRGRAQTQGFLDDYSLLGNGFIALSRASGERIWRDRAQMLADAILRRFERGDSLASTLDTKDLIVAGSDEGDNAAPSGTSAAVALFLRLGQDMPQSEYAAAAQRIAARLGSELQTYPENWASLVTALSDATSGSAALAANPFSTAAHVHATSHVAIQRGGAHVTIVLDVDKGYHINAHPASYGYLIPTSVSFPGVAGARTSYPPATLLKLSFAPQGLKVYQGEVSIGSIIPQSSLKGRSALIASVAVQACTDQVCLRPATLTAHIRL